MRRGGRVLLAALLGALAVVGAAAAERAGPRPPHAAAPPTVRTGEWLCPHGGGEGWSGSLFLANPGAEPVQARITTLGDLRAPDEPVPVTVPAGAQVVRKVDAGAAARATYVEVFGGWAAVSWQVRSEDPVGLGAEPCLPEGGRRWLVVEPTTLKGERSTLVVMNPYSSGAVFDVALFQPDEPPLRDPAWGNLELKAGRALALRIDKKVAGKDPVAAEITVRSGRVAAATLGVTDDGGVRSVIAAAAPATDWWVGTDFGSGESSLLVGSLGDDQIGLEAARIASQGPGEDVQRLLDNVRQASQSTGAYPIATAGPSVAEVEADSPVLVALRSAGQSADEAAGGGLPAPATEWVVGPTVADDPSFPGLVIGNPGQAPAAVRLIALPGEGGAKASLSLQVAAGETAKIPRDFRQRTAGSSILVIASEPVVAFGASSSAGVRGLSLYAIAAGSAVPGWVAVG